MADLETRGLGRLRRDLELVLDELRHAHPYAYGLANAIAVGEDSLHEVKEKIRDFEDTWNNNRDDIVESSEGIVGTVGSIDDVFADLDEQLTAVLEGRDPAAPEGGS